MLHGDRMTATLDILIAIASASIASSYIRIPHGVGINYQTINVNVILTIVLRFN